MGLSSLVRPVGEFLWPIAWTPTLATRIRSLRTRAAIATLAAVLAAAPVFAWSARNEHVVGTFMLSTDGAITLYYYLGAAILAVYHHASIDQQQQSLEHQAGVSDWMETPASLSGYMARRTAEIMVEHPIATIEVELFSFLRLALAPEEAWVREWLNLEGTPDAGEPWYLHMSARSRDILQHPLLCLLMFWQIAWLYVVWLGVWRIWRFTYTQWSELDREARNAIAFMFVTMAILFLLSAPAGSATAGRLRVAFAPFLAILASMGWIRRESLTETGQVNVDNETRGGQRIASSRRIRRIL